jgi:hypothetical protein
LRKGGKAEINQKLALDERSLDLNFAGILDEHNGPK